MPSKYELELSLIKIPVNLVNRGQNLGSKVTCTTRVCNWTLNFAHHWNQNLDCSCFNRSFTHCLNYLSNEKMWPPFVTLSGLVIAHGQ